MQKILLIDTNQTFTSDIERNLIINEYDDIDIITRNNIDEALMQIYSINPDRIVLPGSIVMAANWLDYGISICSYARNNNEIIMSDNACIPCYGIINKSTDLINMIRSNNVINITNGNNKTIQEESDVTSILTSQDNPIETSAAMNDNSNFQQNYYENQNQQDYNQTYYQQQYAYDPNNPYYAYNQYYQQYPNGYYGQEYNQNYNQYYANEQQTQQEQPALQVQNLQQQSSMQQYEQVDEEDAISAKINNLSNNTSNIAKENDTNFHQVTHPENILKAEENITPKTESNNISISQIKSSASNRLTEAVNSVNEDYINSQVNKDLGLEPQKTKCITVYSAKGGVGKTTISCELATFLALTSHGRRNFKVCIADFNIDFGDVLNTLSFNPKGANMTTWAADIRDRINSGENPDDINYPFARIQTWLQHNDKDNLYALLAPLTNADSTEISELEIQVMLRNLLDNCGFDFVICDTGNNTRDSSFIALEMADEILLVLTQNVNTANCNNSFLTTANRIGFDMNKFKLIINKVKPAKLIGITTEELESVFINPNTGKPFECLAKIKDSNDVASSGNLGEPLVYNSSHEFTKTIGEIVYKLLGKQSVLQKSEKKGFFDGIFKKKK